MKTLAFAAVYLIWGSTYLAIRVGVRDFPPLALAGTRFFLAGVLLFLYGWLRGQRGPQGPHMRRDWMTIAATGLLMPAAANGLVTWGEHWVPSNQTALIVATSALWTAWFGSLGARGESLRPTALAGLALGFAGVAVLVGAGWRMQAAPLSAYLALLLSPMLWSFGTILARRRTTDCPFLMVAALQMLIAGVVLNGLAAIHGDWSLLQWSPHVMWALAYLIVFGSCIAYAAYFWLVRHVSPVQLGTTAYVNPAVAAVLGWLLLGEHMTPSQWFGTAIILSGVVVVALGNRYVMPESRSVVGEDA